MKKQTFMTRMILLLIAGSVLLTSCASTTLIQSSPTSAKLYLNGELAGTTPYSHRDTKIVGSTTSVRLELEGYETLNTSFSRNEDADVGAIIGGIFFLFPFLWTMKYKPIRTYELKPKTTSEHKVSQTSLQDVNTQVNSETLRALKQLLEENASLQKNYETE